MTHHHDHQHDVASDLSFEEKLIKLLEHWLKHNHDHAHTYDQWAERAKANDMPRVGALIDEIGELTRTIDEKIKEALANIH